MIKTAITVSLVEEARGGPFVLWDGVEKGCETAAELGNQKARAVISTEPDVVATGNIGCMTQIETHLSKVVFGRKIPVLHTMQILDRAYRGEPLC